MRLRIGDTGCGTKVAWSCLGDTVLVTPGIGNGDIDKDGTERGDGFFLRITGGSGTGGLRILDGGTARPIMPGPLDLIIPPPNFAIASSTDDNSILDPKVGVPHRELALSIISIRSSSTFTVV